MRIVHLCLVGAYNEGWTYQENLLSKYHSRLGHEVTLLCIPLEYHEGTLRVSSEVDYVNKEGVHVIRMPEKINIKNRIVFHRGVSEQLDRISPDIIFIHGCQFWDIGEIRRYLKKHPQIIAYIDNHADFSNSATNWLTKNILHKIIWKHGANKIEPYIKKFYGVLPARVDFLTEVYQLPKEKCELLVMGADDELVERAMNSDARHRIREIHGIENNDFLIVTGGKIDKWKTQTLLLMEAVNKLPNEKIKLIVFGSVADDLKEKVNSISDGIRVQYVGWIDADKSYDYFAASDLVVFPGRHSVFWEQVVGQGIPMIVKDWLGTHHVDVGGNVKFLEDDSADEIAAIIQKLVENRNEYDAMKRVAIEKGIPEFSYRSIAERAIS